MGFPILCEVIREERKDLDMLRTALECLTNAFTSPAASVQAQQVWLLQMIAPVFLFAASYAHPL